MTCSSRNVLAARCGEPYDDDEHSCFLIWDIRGQWDIGGECGGYLVKTTPRPYSERLHHGARWSVL